MYLFNCRPQCRIGFQSFFFATRQLGLAYCPPGHWGKSLRCSNIDDLMQLFIIDARIHNSNYYYYAWYYTEATEKNDWLTEVERQGRS